MQSMYTQAVTELRGDDNTLDQQLDLAQDRAEAAEETLWDQQVHNFILLPGTDEQLAA